MSFNYRPICGYCMRMRLAFSSNAFRAHSIEDTIAILAGIGYDGIELMCDGPHGGRRRLTRRRRARSVRADRAPGGDIQPERLHSMCSYREPRTGRAGTFHWRAGSTGTRTRGGADRAHGGLRGDGGGAPARRKVSNGTRRAGRGRSRDEGYAALRPRPRGGGAARDELGVTVLVEPEPDLLIERSQEYEEFRSRHVDFPGSR